MSLTPFGNRLRKAKEPKPSRDFVVESLEPMILMSANPILGDAADNILDGTAEDDYIRGREGNDLLRGLEGLDHLRGDDGHDLLLGGAGSDLLRGGFGDDTLDGGSGEDDLRGDAGDDTARYVGIQSSDAILIDRGDGRYLVEIDGDRDRLRDIEFLQFEDGTFAIEHFGNDPIVGTDENDTLVGTSSDDELRGLGGSDHLNAGAGNDLLLGGDGADLLRGRDGDDLLDGGLGNDDLRGDAGTDTVRYIGNQSSDAVVTARGDDRYYVEINGERDRLRDVELLQFNDGTFAIEDLLPPSDAGAIGLTLENLTIDEGVGDLNVILFRADGADGEVSVDYTTVAQTADGDDFVEASGTITFGAGETGQQITIDILDDPELETDETFAITLSNPTNGATLGAITTQTITLLDNDEIVEGIVWEDSFEGTDTWTTDPFGTDTATTGAWEAGSPQSTQAGGVTLQPDSGHSGSRALVTGLAAGSSAGFNDIDNGETSVISPTIELPDAPEIALSFEYSLAYLDNATSDDFFAAYIVSGGTETEVFKDHAHGSNQATGWTFATIDVSDFRGQDIQILFKAADAEGPSLVEAAVDDVVVEVLPNLPGTFNLQSTSINLDEDAGTATVVVTRTNGRLGTVTVDYATQTGTAGTDDFTPVSGTLTFVDGQAEAEITVAINDDDVDEDLESLAFLLSNPTGGALLGTDADGTINIVDNDSTSLDYLPDLLPLGSRLARDLTIDTSEQPGRELLRFSTEVANVGTGALELWGGEASGSSQQVFQRIYQEDGHRDVLAGEFVYHPGHGHIHFEGFASYNLRLVNGNGDIIASGGKTSFCLINIEEPFPELQADAGRVHGRGGTSCGNYQGISVGYSDVYSANLDDQWIDITDVADGTYTLEIIADPEDNIIESDETNNTASIQVQIQNGGVTVL